MSNCESCMHVAVCSKYQATGGHVRNCRHYAEQKRGRWIVDREHLKATCSECGNELHFSDEMQIALLHGFEKYCYFCGAEMEGEKDNEKRIEPASMGGVQSAEE